MNNRQANGRRRGRGGQQQQRSGGGQGQRDTGNRIDSRARGNAAQLLEKYKNMARDAQMQGDRVNTEYYLQFADHYFRVLAETRSRFEENNPNANHQPRRMPSTDLEDEDFDYEAEAANRGDEQRAEQPQQRDDRGERQQRDDRQDRQPRDDRGPREDRPQREAREDRPQREARDDRPQREARDDRGDRYERGDRNNDRGDRNNGRANGANGHANGNYRAEPQGEDFTAREGNRGSEGPRAEPGEEQPRRTRTMRPRRDAAPEADVSHSFDAAILPPALEVTSTADEAEAKPKRRGRPRKDAEAPAS
jgi:hypothetical protein